MSVWIAIMIWLAPPDKDFVGPPDPPPVPPARTTADDPQTLRLRIDHNMKAAEEQLRRTELAKTKQLQDEVVRDLEQLLKNQNPPPQDNNDANAAPPQQPRGNSSEESSQADSQTGAGPGGGARNNQSKGDMRPRPGGGATNQDRQQGPGQAKGQSTKQRERRGNRPDMARDQGKSGARPAPANPSNQNRSGDQPGEADGAPGTNADVARGATMRPPPPSKPERLADMNRDVWGHLPETLRQEVDHYYRERFMPRYRELLQQYYNRLAETEHRGEKK